MIYNFFRVWTNDFTTEATYCICYCQSLKMKSSSWGFFFYGTGVSANWSSKGRGTKEHENTDFCQWILLKLCSEKTSPFCSLIPLCTTTCSALSIDFWHNWCLFAPFIQDCHCKPIVRLVMMELYSLKRNSRRLLQHNHKLLARPTCSNSHIRPL